MPGKHADLFFAVPNDGRPAVATTASLMSQRQFDRYINQATAQYNVT